MKTYHYKKVVPLLEKESNIEDNLNTEFDFQKWLLKKGKSSSKYFYSEIEDKSKVTAKKLKKSKPFPLVTINIEDLSTKIKK